MKYKIKMLYCHETQFHAKLEINDATTLSMVSTKLISIAKLNCIGYVMLLGHNVDSL